MPRIYHPSPNCPCPECVEKYRDRATWPLSNKGVGVSLGIRRYITRRGPSPVMDLLDVSEPDRSVLIAVIQAQLTRRRSRKPSTHQGE